MSIVMVSLMIVSGAIGTYWLLPHRHYGPQPGRQHFFGTVLAGVALCCFLCLLSPPGPLLTTVFLYFFSAAAVVGALLTVTSRNPIYSALWFASVVLSTSGLFLLASAPFLAAGTVIVYAGAIIVTFLFVIMLAQMEGKAVYDRSARSPAGATFTCFLLLWCLIYSLTGLAARSSAGASGMQHGTSTLTRSSETAGAYFLQPLSAPLAVFNLAYRPTSWTHDTSGVEKQNVAGLGESLYTDHLVTVGLTGVLLFVALVGAVAITNPKRTARPVTRIEMADR
jgi:NADH-quinone oxidoreductase subunit J